MFKRISLFILIFTMAFGGFMPINVQAADITISNVKVSNITQASATITWISNSSGDSQVRYGESIAEADGSDWDIVEDYAAGRTSHTAVLTGLKSDTIYVFDVRSTSASMGESNRYQGSFSTNNGVSKITVSDVSISNITGTSVTITWSSNTAGDSQYSYGTSIINLSDWVVSESYQSGKLNHSATIKNLESNSYYAFEVRSTNANIGESVAKSGSFKTATDLEIREVSFGVITSTYANISWNTTKPATSHVWYGTENTAGGRNRSKKDENLTEVHNIYLSQLEPNTEYFLEISSKDSEDNFAVVRPKSFTTSKAVVTNGSDSKLPDLVIKDIYYDDRGLIITKYCNEGNGMPVNEGFGIKTFYIKMMANGGKTYNGKTSNTNYLFQTPEVGKCALTDGYKLSLIGVNKGDFSDISTEIDWENSIKESDESNNIFSKSIQIGVKNSEFSNNDESAADSSNKEDDSADDYVAPTKTQNNESNNVNKLVLKLERTISALEQKVVDLENRLVTKIDAALSNRLKGRILLQVEENGEAWYVDPESENKFYMKDGQSSYDIMRTLGLGITNKDLESIPIGIQENIYTLQDTDGDKIPDNLEVAIGTDPNKADTDDDGYDDKTEILSGYRPDSSAKFNFDQSLINRLQGRITLQVESHGEAWYINPDDGHRYYLGDGNTAYNIMRFLSLGISNEDLRKIQVGEYN